MSSRYFTQTLISRIILTTYPTRTTRTIIYSRASFATNNNDSKYQIMSKATELKDQVMGSLKENIGYVIGNKNLQNEGKHQKVTSTSVSSENFVRNRSEYDDVEKKAKSTMQFVAEKATSVKDQVVGATKENLGSSVDKVTATKDKAVETAKDKLGSAAEKATSAKDQVVGAVKENLDSAADKATTIKDKAVETAKDNLGSAAEKATSVKDQVVGTVKENIGYVTGNSTLESEGKIQKNIATDKIPIDKQSIAEKAAYSKEHIVSKAKETIENMSNNETHVDDSKKRLPHADRINAEKILQKNASSQKRNP